jgi:predicted house-cleaning noncanonical NTP pyrophosphatase (MazG superfamily)
MKEDKTLNRIKENIMDKNSVIIYNKLVRDKIPQIIEADGKKCEIRIAGKEELVELLEAKLMEEAEEFKEAKNLEELADLMEVVFGLAKALGYDEGELLEKRGEKREERGGFEDGIVLENVIIDVL